MAESDYENFATTVGDGALRAETHCSSRGTGRRLAAETDYIASTVRTGDFDEGGRAFVEKRPPAFEGH